jgi:beta-xylosidase
LERGTTAINGPHQGAWVETQTGESWFFHFQDKDAYGRIVHLQPMKWVNDFPVIGIDIDKNDIGEPVEGKQKKPNVGKNYPTKDPSVSDEFSTPKLGLQWQWEANPQQNWYFMSTNEGVLKLYNTPVPVNTATMWGVPNVLLQKFPAANFTATTKLTFYPKTTEEETGLIITGMDYSFVSIRKTASGLALSQVICKNAVDGQPEKRSADIMTDSNTIYFKVQVQNIDNTSPEYVKIGRTDNESPQGNALCTFSYSLDGTVFMPIGAPFFARKGKWIGSKLGLFALRKGKTYEHGYADVDWFRIDKN